MSLARSLHLWVAPRLCWRLVEIPYGDYLLKATNRKKRFLALALLTSLTLGPSVFGGSLLAGIANAKGKANSRDKKSRKHDKVASDLRERLASRSTVKVILQLDGKPSGQLNALLASNGIKIRKHFDKLNSFAIELPTSVVDSLSEFPEVSFVSVDSEIRSFGGHVATTTGNRQRSFDGG